MEAGVICVIWGFKKITLSLTFKFLISKPDEAVPVTWVRAGKFKHRTFHLEGTLFEPALCGHPQPAPLPWAIKFSKLGAPAS